MNQLTRSIALNNIPVKKLQDRLYSVIQACETCSLKGISPTEALDGLCSKCSLLITLANRYYESNIPLEYWNLKMEKDFVGDPRLLTKYNEITADFKKTYIEGKSICFAGSHGIGKTFVNCAILKKATQRGFSCLYTTLTDIVNVLTQAEGSEKYLAKRELTMVDYLVLDEVDPRFIATDNASDLYARTLESIFRTRSQNQMPTFICTNSPNVVETFNGALKQSIGSLMSGKLEMFVVLGEDFRKKNK